MKENSLSVKAQGLYCKLVSLSDDWNFTEEGLTFSSTDKLASIKSGLKELEKIGLLVRRKIKVEKGYFDMEYIIFDFSTKQNPMCENPTLDFPIKEIPMCENHTYNKELMYKETINKEISNTISENLQKKIEEIWNEYPSSRRVDKKKIFEKLRKEKDKLDFILERLKQHKESSQWKNENGKYIPLISTWINQERWEQELEKEKTIII